MIVKVTSWVRPGRGARAKAKATVRYLMHRPDRDGRRASRQLFGSDGPMTRRQAYELIDAARRGSVFYRITISPDPRREDTNKDLHLWGLTQSALQFLQEALGKELGYVAVVHGDQTDIRHVSLLLIIPGRLSREQFRALPKLLREKARLEALRQRRMLDWDRHRAAARQAPSQPAPSSAAPHAFRPNKYPGHLSVRPLKPLCPQCLTSQKMWRIDTGRYFCVSCGLTYAQQGYSGGLEREGARAL